MYEFYKFAGHMQVQKSLRRLKKIGLSWCSQAFYSDYIDAYVYIYV